MNLYTDINAECCAWLAARVEDGSLPAGDVLMADIRDLRREHLTGYGQVHCFCGIGGFPLGLAWAGWPDDISVVTGGFPCQDISAAGKGAGLAGKRSGLFWELDRVIDLLRTHVVVAENVGALEGRGLDAVAAALESRGYDVIAIRVGAWALGAPHERERWWIVGVSRSIGDAHKVRRRAERVGQARRVADGRGAEVFANALRKPGDQQARHAVQPGQADDSQHVGVGRLRRAVFGDAPLARDGGVSAGRGRSDEASIDADGPGSWQVLQRDAGGGSGRLDSAGRAEESRAAAGWAGAVVGPWRRVDDEWQYAGAPVFVYRGGPGRGQQHSATVAGGTADPAGGLDQTRQRGWPVPVLPGRQQHAWELPRVYQRGVGDAVHGLSGRVVDSLNRCGVMALGNAVVPQVVAAVAAGVIEMVKAKRIESAL